MFCPLIVEDLSVPGQMLIEASEKQFHLYIVFPAYVTDSTEVCMIKYFGIYESKKYSSFLQILCEEQGFFLEIVDIIRGFGLTVLKGVMEVRETKIWARFNVEAEVILN